jgi:hypothetical protein
MGNRVEDLKILIKASSLLDSFGLSTVSGNVLKVAAALNKKAAVLDDIIKPAQMAYSEFLMNANKLIATDKKQGRQSWEIQECLQPIRVAGEKYIKALDNADVVRNYKMLKPGIEQMNNSLSSKCAEVALILNMISADDVYINTTFKTELSGLMSKLESGHGSSSDDFMNQGKPIQSQQNKIDTALNANEASLSQFDNNSAADDIKETHTDLTKNFNSIFDPKLNVILTKLLNSAKGDDQVSFEIKIHILAVCNVQAKSISYEIGGDPDKDITVTISNSTFDEVSVIKLIKDAVISSLKELMNVQKVKFFNVNYAKTKSTQ